MLHVRKQKLLCLLGGVVTTSVALTGSAKEHSLLVLCMLNGQTVMDAGEQGKL